MAESRVGALGRRARRLGREGWGLSALWALAGLGCLLGLKPATANTASIGALAQVVDMVRIVATTSLAIVLILGPGLALRAMRFGPKRLGFLPLPGMGLLAVTGGAAWGLGLAGWVHPRFVCAAVLGSVLLALPFGLARARRKRGQLLSSEEWRALMLVGGALGIAIARALWSLDLPGELYAGTIYRTLEVGDRPDSRISYHLVQLIANGNSPFGTVATGYLTPYTFSDRGPLPSLASVPIILATGGHPPVVIGTAAWSPFDFQGFMAYRLAMMTLASSCLLSLWTLTQRLAGRRAAHLAVLLGATTPFVVHEIWFTWPKLLAASFVLLAAVSLIDRRRVAAGLLLGIGYLCHPLALLALPALGLLALWPLVGARLKRPRIGSGLLVAIGVAVCLIGWWLINGSHYTQNGFTNMLSQAGPTNLFKGVPVTLSLWLNDRLVSLANTLVPLHLFFFSAMDQEVNSALQPCWPFCSGGSPAIEHFFFQYWNTLPFGIGIVLFPVLLVSLARALWRWPWAVTVAVIVPFVAFAVYWGGASTGMLREGLQPWVLVLLAVVAVEQHARGFPWLRSRALRAVLALRALEVLAVAMLPTIWTVGRVWSTQFWLSDIVAAIVMVWFSLWLGLQAWCGFGWSGRRFWVVRCWRWLFGARVAAKR